MILLYLPPAVVMSQNALIGFPVLFGSNQYSPVPCESPMFKMLKHDFPGESLVPFPGWRTKDMTVDNKSRFKKEDISLIP